MEESNENRKKRFNWKRVLFYTVGTILLLVIITFLFLNHFVGKSLEVVEGTIELSEITDDVTVVTDDDGVPHIKATNEQDLYIAQGYVQAQRRMLQMELSRRQASGTLSEIVGSGALSNEKYFHALGLRLAVETYFVLCVI